MGYCSLAKKNFGYREAVGAWIVEIWSKYSLYFGYACSVGDALINGKFIIKIKANIERWMVNLDKRENVTGNL